MTLGQTPIPRAAATWMLYTWLEPRTGRARTVYDGSDPRVGCVLVRDGRVIGEGWHERAGQPHAEVLALRAAGTGEARGCHGVRDLEPCSHTGLNPPPVPMRCCGRHLTGGPAPASDPNPKVAGSGMARLEAHGVCVSAGLLAQQARELNVGFFSRFERGRPFVRLKLAMSLDARTTAAAGGPHWITGQAARADVQTWRARSSAVLTGAGTVRSDDPRLDVRLGLWALDTATVAGRARF